MINPKESDEREYLKKVLEKLHWAFDSIEQKISNYSREILETKRYMYENKSQLDPAEKAANRIEVRYNVTFGESAIKEREKLNKLIQSPYFGRIDYTNTGEANEQAVYIGIHSFIDPQTSHNIIFDWRAPISSLFYDFELGPAYYLAPLGKIEGKLNLKRQYRIRKSQMEFMIESSLNIDDEILQKELNQTSDDKMKNIVATIQREQNMIIRNEDAKVLILQGVAGSGKTSIALHRVAFLLYRYKGTLTSNNILIISPNKVFSSYISNVLPELGEENILEMSFDDIATALIGKKYKYQTFFQQVESLLEDENDDIIEKIRFKSSNQFVELLQSYLEYSENEYFQPKDLNFGAVYIFKKDLLLRYNAYKKLPIKKRLEKIADDLIARYKRDTGKTLNSKVIRQIRDSILNLYKFPDALSLYRNFYHYIKREELFRFIRKSTFEFSDVFPFIYVKMFFDGVEQDYKTIQHLLVDEMQDYTPIQYAVLVKLFSCKMTILGDSNQSLNPYSSSTIEKIQPFFQDSDCMELCKSYRSTVEISRFAQKIQENKKLVPIERHGEKPKVTICSTEDEELAKIQDLIQQFKSSGYNSLGVICKSQKSANELFEKLRTISNSVQLLDFNSSEFKEGITVSSVHLSKGLEFDQVIVPDVSEECYNTQLDRSLLYIACTRAMHKLDLTCHGKRTKFI